MPFLLARGCPGVQRFPPAGELTLDLIRKLARLQGEECDSDPEDWYRGKFKKEADYSEILDNLAKTSAEYLVDLFMTPSSQD